MASLHHHQIILNNKEHRGVAMGSNYDVFQGTVMGQLSKILGIKRDKFLCKIFYTGLVVFDSLSY